MRTFIACLLLLSFTVAANSNKDVVVENWLHLVDTGKVDKSWQVAAPLFKQQVSAKKWQQLVSLARGPLGKLKQRELLQASEYTSLPNVPDGK